MKKKIILWAMLMTSCIATAFGQIGIGTDTPNPTAMLDVTSTEKGFLPPRMTTLQRDTIEDPAEGLVIYNTDQNCLQFWNMTEWTGMCDNPYPPGYVHCLSPTIVVDVTNPVTGKTWMDRNLGASRVATAYNDEQSYGDLYQWGRAADGHQCRTSATTVTLSTSDQPGHGNYILNSSPPHDWRNPTNPELWVSTERINNPCPAGYRIPTYDELVEESQTWSTQTHIDAFGSPLKLPASGSRRNDNGILVSVGSVSTYWTWDGTSPKSLSFRTSGASTITGGNSRGIAVRCIKE